MRTSRNSYRIGFDIGGTFTDFVLHDGQTGKIRLYKCLTTPSDPSEGAMEGLQALVQLAGLKLSDIDDVIHGTTLVTNAIIERKGARCALLTTRGFRDVLEAGFEQRYDVHDLFLKFPDPLVPRHLRREVNERVARGDVLVPLDMDEVARVVKELAHENVEAIAVCFLHSYDYREHERAVGEFLAREYPHIAVSLSSDVVAELGEYERTSTTCANAFVQPLMNRYLEKLERRLKEHGFSGRLSLMLSSGGLTTPETARRLPIRLLESGPAGGGLATALVGRSVQMPDLISFDMGGTTAKATLIENYQVEIAAHIEAGRIERFKKGSGIPIKAPVIDMIEIGAGGGSIASVDELGLLKVGPRSAGASPGPACYGLGGDEPTVTDANLLLGYLDPASFLGGEMRLEPDNARQALARVGAPLDLNALQSAWGIYQIVCENMASAAGIHIIEKGHDPRRYAMVAIGGAGPAHAARVARLMGLREVLIPQASGAASAMGFLSAPSSFEGVRSAVMTIDEGIDLSSLNKLLGEIEAEARAHVLAAGVDSADIVVQRSADMRLRGQFHQITIPISDDELSEDSIVKLKEEFHLAYERHYNKVLPGAIEAINWRVRVIGPTPAIELLSPTTSSDQPVALKGSRAAFFGTNYVETAVYDRYALRPGDKISGPAIIEERESTTVVPPSDTLEVDAAFNLRIRLGQIAAPARLVAEGTTIEPAIAQIESDPVTLEILWSRMVNITEQCWTTICRTAFSQLVGVAQDFSVEILDRNGDTVASNPRGQPAFDLCMPVTARELLKCFPHETLQPGDVLVTNDPWLAAGHLDDVAIIIPIFGEGIVVGHIGVIAHVTDIGGSKRSGAAELYEEGLQIPPLKLYRADVANDDLFAIIARNVREKEQVLGDIMALVGAGRMGARAVTSLLDEYGLRDLVAFGRIVQSRSEAAMRNAIRLVPNGTYRSEVSVDIGGTRARFPVEIEVQENGIVIDLEGAPPQVYYGGFNSSYNYTAARAKNPVKCLLTPHIRANEGCYRPIEVVVPKGSMLDCVPPAPVRDRVVSGWNVTPVVLSALAEAMPDRAQAFSGYPALLTFYGRDASGDFSDYLMCGGGQGGSSAADGKSGLLFPTSSANTSVELTEVRVPIVVEEKSFVPDSGGAGKHRGGLAQRLRIRKLLDDGAELRVGVLPAGIDLQIPAMFGGRPGSPVMSRGIVENKPANQRQNAWILTSTDDCVEVTLSGGHGYGSPSLRPKSMIERDIAQGYVSIVGASRDYEYEAQAVAVGIGDGDAMGVEAKKGRRLPKTKATEGRHVNHRSLRQA